MGIMGDGLESYGDASVLNLGWNIFECAVLLGLVHPCWEEKQKEKHNQPMEFEETVGCCHHQFLKHWANWN